MKLSLSLLIAISILVIFSSCEGLFDTACQRSENQMVLIKGSEIEQIGYDYYIDSYESSRSSASETEQGTFTGRACNYAGTIPWNNITYTDAKIACQDAGKRLCTEMEWRFACASENNNTYPYGSSYVQGNCNDSGTTAHAGGVNQNCTTPNRLYDLSGNLREWVNEGKRMGGSYNSNATELTCASALSSPDHLTAVAQPSDGFRCCQDVI